MDFHSLTRKELQALCKKNKIPANITNVAMADALAALDTVEGLEELLKQSQSVDPESPAMPRTVTRTSTRRKPVKDEPETAQPTTRTRGRTRRAMDLDLDQENKNVNVVEPETAQPTTRTRDRTRRAIDLDLDLENKNVNVVESPAMPVSSRRAETTSAVQTGYSTRRSVRLLEKSLAELSFKEAVKMNALADETEEKDVSGSLEKTNDSSSGEVMETERESKDEIKLQENEDMITQDSSHLGLDAQDDSLESSDQLDKKGPVDAPVAEFTSENENPIAKVCDEISAAGHKKADESGDDEVVETEKASAEVMETENAPDEVSTEVVAAEEEDLELPFDPDSWETDSNQSVNESNVDNKDSDFHKSAIGKEDAEEEVVKESFVFDSVQASENLQVEMEQESSASDGEVEISPKFAKQTGNPSCPPPSANEAKGNDTSEIELISADKAEDVVESKKDMIDDVSVIMPSQEYDDFAANLPPLPDTPPSGEKMSPCHPVSITKIPQMSLLGTDTIATQFPRPTQSLTPVRSSSKKQTTDQKLTFLLADNKENTENSGMTVEPKKDDKVKKKKNIIDVDSLNEKSLRELTKMFKEQVQIHNKKKNIDEDQTKAQVGKTRPALQTLTDNVMLP